MAQRSVRLTHDFLDTIKVEAREVWHDSACQNLIVRVGTGERASRVFYWYGRAGGKPTFTKIGVYPAMTVTAARDEAKRLTGLVALGQIPKARATIARDEMTLGKLFQWYMTTHAKPHKKTSHEDQRNWEKRLQQWSSWKLSKVTKDRVRELHLEINQKNGRNDGGPYAANKMLELLGFMWRLGQKELNFSTPDPTDGIKRFQKVERERFLDSEELPKFLKAVNELQRETTRDFILLALLTGARRSNVCSMRWDQINLKAKLWTIPRINAKGQRQSIRVVLGADAIEILNRRKQTATTEWVLPSSGPSGHVTDPKAALQSILKRSGLKDIRFHDLRRTFGSWQAINGASMLIIGKSLGHTSTSATKVYARLNIDPVRDSVDAATAEMMKTQK